MYWKKKSNTSDCSVILQPGIMFTKIKLKCWKMMHRYYRIKPQVSWKQWVEGMTELSIIIILSIKWLGSFRWVLIQLSIPLKVAEILRWNVGGTLSAFLFQRNTELCPQYSCPECKLLSLYVVLFPLQTRKKKDDIPEVIYRFVFSQQLMKHRL